MEEFNSSTYYTRIIYEKLSCNLHPRVSSKRGVKVKDCVTGPPVFLRNTGTVFAEYVRFPVPGARRAPGAFGFYPVIFDRRRPRVPGGHPGRGIEDHGVKASYTEEKAPSPCFFETRGGRSHSLRNIQSRSLVARG